MDVLIVTEPDDSHAVLVKLALERKGARCELLFSADMPSQQINTLHLSNTQWSWDAVDTRSTEMLRCDASFDAIWWRRPRKPYLPDSHHEEDKAFIKKENAIYHESIPYLFNETAWWVNPLASHAKTRSKIVQLKLAAQCGFAIPQTLISNSPTAIREFLQIHATDRVIYKPFLPQCWAEKEGLKIVYTDTVSLEDLPCDSLLQAVPGIYQQYVEKKYELRVTCFGSDISAIKIDSQPLGIGQIDWRKIPGELLPLSEIALPQTIKDKIIAFMQKIGVVFGCFDFIVTPEDEVVFLELNEQGQFLWVEDVLPQVCYLDRFAEFLLAKRFDFSWKKTQKTVHVSELDASAERVIESNINQHVYLNAIKRVA